MTPDRTVAMTQKLRSRSLSHSVRAVIFGSAGLFLASKHLVVAALVLIGLATISGLVATRSVKSLLRMRRDGPDAS